MYALSYIINDLFCLVIMAIIFACHLQSTDTRQSTGLFRGMVIGMMALVGCSKRAILRAAAPPTCIDKRPALC